MSDLSEVPLVRTDSFELAFKGSFWAWARIVFVWIVRVINLKNICMLVTF